MKYRLSILAGMNNARQIVLRSYFDLSLIRLWSVMQAGLLWSKLALTASATPTMRLNMLVRPRFVLL